MSKHLYKKDGSGTIGDFEIDRKITAFVEDIVTSNSKYNNAELELYVMEQVMGEFLRLRVRKRASNIKRRKDL